MALEAGFARIADELKGVGGWIAVTPIAFVSGRLDLGDARTLGATSVASVGDLVFRCGGDEFVVLMPGSRLASGMAASRRISDSLRKRGDPLFPEPVMLSIGVCELTDGESMEHFLKRTGQRLYDENERGRDVIVS